MGDLTTEEFQKLLEKAVEPLRKSIDEVKKSMATANFNYDQLLTKMSAYEKGMTDLFNENKSLKAELLDTTNKLKALKESFKHGAILYNEAEVFSLSITNPNGRPMLPFDWLIQSSLILARCHKMFSCFLRLRNKF